MTENTTNSEWYCPIITVDPPECVDTRYSVVLNDTYLYEEFDCLCSGDLIEDPADEDGECICPDTQFPSRNDPTVCVCRDTEVMLDDGTCGCADFMEWLDFVDTDDEEEATADLTGDCTCIAPSMEVNGECICWDGSTPEFIFESKVYCPPQMPCYSGRSCNVPLCDCEDTCGDFVIPEMVMDEGEDDGFSVELPDLDIPEIDDSGPTGSSSLIGDGDEYLDYDYGFYYNGEIIGYYDFYFGYYYDDTYGEYYDGYFYDYYYDISPYYTEIYQDYSEGNDNACDDWYDYTYGSYWNCESNDYYDASADSYYEGTYGSWYDNYYQSYYDGLSLSYYEGVYGSYYDASSGSYYDGDYGSFYDGEYGSWYDYNSGNYYNGESSIYYGASDDSYYDNTYLVWYSAYTGCIWDGVYGSYYDGDMKSYYDG